MRIGLTFDLRDTYRALGYSEEAVAEFDTEETIAWIESTVRAHGHEVERIGTIWQLTEALAAGTRWDLVFNVAEGLHGMAREAQVPALLDAYGIPYTFATPDVLVYTLDKAMAKRIVRDAGIATAPFALVREEADIARINLAFPLFVKPIAEGTGKGISAASVVENAAQLAAQCRYVLREFSQAALVESYLTGREFTVGLLGEGDVTRAIAAMEIVSGAEAEAGGHTWKNKENCEVLMEYFIRDDADAQAAITVAIRAWQVLGCRDAGRVDVRLDAKGVACFIEANPLSGLHPTHSDLPMLADKVGMSYHELIGHILGAASARVAPQSAARTAR